MKTRLPDGWHSVTPRIVTDDVGGLVEFLRRAFGATGEVHPDRPAVMRIGDSMIMVSGIGPRAAMPAFLYVYLDDADAAYLRALKAGAKSLEEPINTPYGRSPGNGGGPLGQHLADRDAQPISLSPRDQILCSRPLTRKGRRVAAIDG